MVVCSVVVLVSVGETTGWDFTLTQLGSQTVTATAAAQATETRVIGLFIAFRLHDLDRRRYGVLPDLWLCKTRRWGVHPIDRNTAFEQNLHDETKATESRRHRFHRIGMSGSKIDEVIATLARCSLELAHSNRKLEEGVIERKAAEDALAAGGCESKKLLKESADLHAHLQSLSRKLLKASEDERMVMGLRLQDEIVQTLAAINFRLLALKSQVAMRGNDVKKELGITEQLVRESVEAINSFTRENGNVNEI